jgi:L-lysine 2,3-aminomutase
MLIKLSTWSLLEIRMKDEVTIYSSVEKMEELKYLGTTLTNQNPVLEEINDRLKSRNACYHSL